MAAFALNEIFTPTTPALFPHMFLTSPRLPNYLAGNGSTPNQDGPQNPQRRSSGITNSAAQVMNERLRARRGELYTIRFLTQAKTHEGKISVGRVLGMVLYEFTFGGFYYCSITKLQWSILRHFQHQLREFVVGIKVQIKLSTISRDSYW